MSRKLDFYFDYVSPYTYLANTQVSSLGLDINFVPVVIVDVMKRVNNQPSPLCPPKGMYIVIDAARWAGIYGVPMVQNGGFWEAVMTGRFSTKTLTRGAVAALKMGLWDKYHDAMFRAIWAEARDVHTTDGLAEFARTQGLPGNFWDHAGSPEIEAQTDANNEQAAGRGVFGSPTFFLDEEIFFGNDRLDMIRQRLGQPERGLSKSDNR